MIEKILRKIVDWNRGGRESRDFELSQIENFCWNRVEFHEGEREELVTRER